MTVSTPHGAMRVLISAMSFSSGCARSAENATTFTPASTITLAMVRLSKPPDTQAPTVLPLRSDNVKAICKASS